MSLFLTFHWPKQVTWPPNFRRKYDPRKYTRKRRELEESVGPGDVYRPWQANCTLPGLVHTDTQSSFAVISKYNPDSVVRQT